MDARGPSDGGRSPPRSLVEQLADGAAAAAHPEYMQNCVQRHFKSIEKLVRMIACT